MTRAARAVRGTRRAQTSRSVRRKDLWRRYRETGDGAARDELLRSGVRLVQQAARTIVRRRKRRLSVDDLMSAGAIGLVEALERFDPEAGTSFHYYAAQRIRGAMLDALRSEERLPRTLIEKRDELHRVRAQLAQAKGSEPHAAEIAKAMAVPLQEYWGLVEALHRQKTVWIEPDEPSQPEEIQALADPGWEDPLTRLIAEEDAQHVRQAIRDLPERDRTVLSLYFSEGLLLREIGSRLGVTEGRVCQLQQRALRRLRARLEAGPGQPMNEEPKAARLAA